MRQYKMVRKGGGAKKCEGQSAVWGQRHPFKSWGEAQIDRCLQRHGVPHLYEHPLAVIDRGHTRIWYPDFQLPGYGVLIEYGGRCGDSDYENGWRHKAETYRANGYDAIMLRREDLRGAWPRKLLGSIEGILVERVCRFRQERRRTSSEVDRR